MPPSRRGNVKRKMNHAHVLYIAPSLCHSLVCAHMYVENTHMYVENNLWSQQALFFFSLKWWSLLLVWNSPCQLVWLAGEFHRATCLYMPGTGSLVSTLLHQLDSFNQGSRSQTQVIMFTKQVLYLLSCLSPSLSTHFEMILEYIDCSGTCV